MREVMMAVSWYADELKPDADGVYNDDYMHTANVLEGYDDVEEVAEDWARTHWIESVHGETECFVRDGAGVVHKVTLTVDYDPVFSAHRVQTCGRCGGSKVDPKDTSVPCIRCHGQGVC